MFAVNKFKALAGAALVAASVLLTGCGSENSSEGPLKVGVMAGPEADVMKVAADIAKKDHDVNVELVEFSDYVSPNVALADGSIDANAFQHKPYLDSMIRDRGFKLAAAGNTFVYPIGAYSKKIKDISELKDGAKVAIPNDPSNEGRTLILLDKKGFIKLKDINNLEATPADIVENPKNLKFIELDAAQLPRSLDDVDLAFINSTYSVPAGLLPARDALLVEGKDSPYVNLIVAREDNKDDPRIKALVESYHTQAVEDKAKELFKGSAVPGWK
ncbi:MetQ/NlpA family ABC transporter substrate-binding protein [Endozoicomonas arenosclerae]|uniref:MetQ/NlpA family ABC transporter substrate-binding protein n=1 Tax=Endozoicomonas arenosclerae TaxID=1633495 RepID=UPI000781FD7A|nr:MetQ/NlpA family ABC transporter substrate-binding protein [Endozoicomonas arenosclerae]